MNFIYDHDKEIETLEKTRDMYSTEEYEAWEEKLKTPVDPTIANLITKTIKRKWKEFYEDKILFCIKSFYDGYELRKDLGKVEVRLSRLNKCPYNFRKEPLWFGCPIWAPTEEQMRVVGHELCHFFQPVELPPDFKEAIPVILNNVKGLAFDEGHGGRAENKLRQIIPGLTLKELLAG